MRAEQVLLRSGHMCSRSREYQCARRRLLPHQYQHVYGDQVVIVVLLRWYSPCYGLDRSAREWARTAPQGKKRAGTTRSCKIDRIHSAGGLEASKFFGG